MKSSRFIYIYTLVEKQVGSAGTEFRSQIPSADNIHGAELFISDFFRTFSTALKFKLKKIG